MEKKRLTRADIKRLEEQAGEKSNSAILAALLELLEWSFYGFVLYLLAKFTKPVWGPVYEFIAAQI